MAIYDPILKLDGSDVFTTFGLAVADLNAVWAGPTRSFDEVTIPGHEGSVATLLTPTVEARDLIFTAELGGTSASDYETKLDALKYGVYRQSVTVLPGNHTDREIVGDVVAMPVTMPYFEMDLGRVEIRIRCRDPFFHKTSATTVTASETVDVETPLGTHSSLPVITIESATDPVVLYKNSSGTTLGTFTLAGTGDFIVDCAAQTVSLDGTRNDALMVAGDFFALDPHDGVPSTSDWPTVRTSDGDLTVTFTERYL